MQAFDFYSLYTKYGVNMQFGGDDQWSNMLAGTELIRRKLGKDAHALTINLLLNSEGKKMGKTSSGAVWLDANKTEPLEFYQYWRNVDDKDVLKCIKMLTFVPLDEIKLMESWSGSKLNEAKDILAYELTKLVHGEEVASDVRQTSKDLFSGSGISANMPTVNLTKDDFDGEKIELATILVKSGLCSSKGDARRNIQQGGVSVDEEKIIDDKKTYTSEELKGEGIIIKKGKKNIIKAILSLVLIIISSFF